MAPVGHYAILKEIGADCKYFDKDLTYSTIADTYKEWLFYKDNEAYLTSTRLTLPKYQNTVEAGAGAADLFGRFQIQRTCDTFC